MSVHSVASCANEVSRHATSLMASLNLQREEAQFCDCVVRHRQSPGQLYPAHRCVLAASSPVLASILSSTGALVELQAPCLSDSVLEHLLDYIYTGVLPYTCSQQNYLNLLNAACYLQMDELQDALGAWQQTEVNDATNASTRVDTEGQTDQFHSDSSSQCSLSSSSSSSLCCGAVPVICYSSRAAMLPLAEVSMMPSYPPVYHASASSCSRAPVSRLASTDNDSTVEGITTKHKNHYRAQNQDYKNSSDQGTLIQDSCKSSAGQSNMLKQDYNSSNVDHFITQNDQHMGSGLSHITYHNDRHVHCDSFQSDNTNHHRDDPVLLNCDDFPSKHQRLESTYSCDVSLAITAKEQSINSQDPRTLVPLPVEDLDTGSDSLFKDLPLKGEVKEEHSSSWYTDNIEVQDSHCKLAGPTTDWYPNSHRAEKSTKDTASWQRENDSDNSNTAIRDKRQSANVCLPASASLGASLDNASECHTSRELEKISDTATAEPHITKPVDSNMSDPTYSDVGQSYHGHLYYHCLSQEETYFTHRDSDHKHSNPGHPVHFNQDNSDQSSDEEEAGTFASPGHSPLRQHLATGTTDQVLLLDISTKPAELLVSYKHSPGEEDKVVGEQDTSETGVGNNGRKQHSETTFVAGVDRRKTGVKFRTDSFDEAKTKIWVREINVKERKSVEKDQSRPGANVIHKAGCWDVEDVPSSRESEMTSILTVCTPPSVPVQASMSATFSVSIPSTLSASMPTNISARLSNPVHHPFQCSLCDRSFSQRGSLNRHVRSHLGVRPFPCPRCPMTFSRQYRVTEHMRVHERCELGSDFQKHLAS
ncbi:hypothetical protein PAMP_000704 [Pampus punctatissimus]